jgi:hypothetical protein
VSTPLLSGRQQADPKGGVVHTAILYLTLALQSSVANPVSPADSTSREAHIRQLIGDIARSGRVLELGNTKQRLADPRKQIAPGAPPLLSFRYFDGADRHRFGKLDVIMDDAGH